MTQMDEATRSLFAHFDCMAVNDRTRPCACFSAGQRVNPCRHAEPHGDRWKASTRDEGFRATLSLAH